MKTWSSWKFALSTLASLSLTACGVDRLSVGAGAPDGAGGKQSGTSGSGGELSPSAGFTNESGGSAGDDGSAGDGGSTIGGSAGGSTVGGSAGDGGSTVGGSAGGLVCEPNLADCDGLPQNACEVDLRSTETCGTSCSDAAACDAEGSGAACVNGGCTSDWTPGLMPNAPTTDPDAPNQAKYADNGDETLRDLITGLIWQKSNRPGVHDWEEAKAYCARLTLAGANDWRLPSRLELVSIEDPSFDRTGPFVYVVSPSDPLAMFWSSTVLSGSPASAWFVGGPMHSARPKSEGKYVRCVR
jgi:hypothetical protein